MVVLQGTLVIVCDGKGVMRLQGQASMVTIHQICEAFLERNMAPRQPLQDAKWERRLLEQYLDQEIVTESCKEAREGIRTHLPWSRPRMRFTMWRVRAGQHEVASSCPGHQHGHGNTMQQHWQSKQCCHGCSPWCSKS